MIHIGLFEGIGGFSVAAKWMGWQTLVTCEIADFPNNILQYHYPEAYHHDDIHTLTYEKINQELKKRYGSNWRTNDIILTGGFPCQPYSLAGKRKGKEDERHLWPEMLRAIREIQPTWVVGENVRGLVNWNGGMVFDEVQADLEAAGYEVIPFILPACGVNAPHRRDRVWFIAYSDNARRSTRLRQVSREDEEVPERNQDAQFSNSGDEFTSNANNEGLEGQFSKSRKTECAIRKKRKSWNSFDNRSNSWDNFPTQSPVLLGNDGFQTESLRQRIREDSMGYLSEKEIDKIVSKAINEWREESIKAAGNAVVPQVVLQIFKAIQAVNDEHFKEKTGRGQS